MRDFSDASYHSRGKQKTKRGGIWYTPQSGIWQTVWVESVSEEYIEELSITPLFDQSTVEITAFSNYADSQKETVIRVGDVVAYGTANQPIRMSMSGFRAWSPESPYLYDMDVRMGEDSVKSYFAMRKFSVDIGSNGAPRLMLNNKPYFHNGVLDQGYWPDGLYTAPSDEAFIHDILTMKAYGYNTLRKHIKIEPMRFYYHCDRLGMLVWQDMPNGGELYKTAVVSLPLLGIGEISDGEANYARFGRANAEGRAQYYAELKEMVLQLYNCPCIAMWVPFNEGWGQFDAAEAVRRGTTRAEISMEKAAKLAKPCIFAIGNAPTALLAIHDLVTAGKLSCALVIGAPVGFVNIIESKEKIMTLDIPYIVARGRKGGSGVAAVVCNALIYQIKR